MPNMSCGTPDPFASLGGGVCINGGWVMRGMGGAPEPENDAEADEAELTVQSSVLMVQTLALAAVPLERARSSAEPLNL